MLQTAKPLMWERLKYTERFQFAGSKVVHVVADDERSEAWRHTEW